MTGQPPPEPSTTVLVAVGTDTHPFGRLLSWLEHWHARLPDPPRLIVQYGTSPRPKLPGAVPYLAHDELRAAMDTAALVVSHGGPATITEARRAGRLPLVVPRDPGLGEHVDDHQLRFARRLAAAHMIRLCPDEATLAAALDAGLADPAPYQLTSDPGERAARRQAVARVGRIVENLVRPHRTGRVGRRR